MTRRPGETNTVKRRLVGLGRIRDWSYQGLSSAFAPSEFVVLLDAAGNVLRGSAPGAGAPEIRFRRSAERRTYLVFVEDRGHRQLP